MGELRHNPILVAIETDATRFHGEHARRPELLGRNEAEQLLAHIASDLAVLFPRPDPYSLCMPGALFDQTQILRPEFPVYAALESLVLPPTGNGAYQPNLLSIGASGGHMPLEALQPKESITPGILQVLPLLVSAPADISDKLFDQMEHRFIEEGQVSAHSAKALETGFGIRVSHARLMTLTDLHAMLHMQLEHFGFSGLWQLLDSAIYQHPEAFEVQGQHGTHYRWDGQSISGRFETFDTWAAQGEGRNLPANGQARAEAYGDWTREYRQYLVTLAEHGLSVSQHLPGQRATPLYDTFLLEESSARPAGNSAQITEHSCGELGTVAVTVVDGDRLLNLYPLRPEGLNDLHAHLRAMGLSGGSVSFPGTIRLDRDARHLQADRI